jgi:potassium efflux system protein
VIAVGFLAAFEAIGMDWSKFGWMAAALGVGLGFGLQEIVANFVSGIILLFERPIRVGDVVTVGETSGVVSRIRIRATTITDWDRKEFVVPNKEFITGRLLNWTLTNKVNRIVVKVGVAYGSDVQKVRDLLMEIVGEHPMIMDDPAPGVTLDNFGDSSLDFTVRCYLPDLDRRLATIHELHGEIHDRFAKEGIEIPFPQRDLNIRSGWGGEE